VARDRRTAASPYVLPGRIP